MELTFAPIIFVQSMYDFMKVVINNCFGGFSLSPLAVKRLAELNGKECYFYKDNYNGPKQRIDINDIPEKSFSWTAFTIGDASELEKYLGDDDWGRLTYEERKVRSTRYELVSLSTREYCRNDKFLVQVVEELGDKADGACASLEIVEIPDDVDYEIDEYDGNEHIAEKHRTWG